MELEEVRASFAATFKEDLQIVVRAPGRVNLIGEHTDYNDGFVFPAAIDRHITIAASRRADRRVCAHSADFSQDHRFDFDDLRKDLQAPWCNYVKGVIQQYQQRNDRLLGMNLWISGNVPIGSGLSSSAALEVATAETCRVLNDLEIDRVEMARLCQAAESRFVGVNCGIMDQFVSTLAEEGSALFLDCRDLSYSLVPLEQAVRIVVCDSRVQRTLDDSAYNQRRSECEEAVGILSGLHSGIRALRDVSGAELEQASSHLPEIALKRARHVVSENERVLESIRLLEEREWSRFGKLLNESHRSLRDDYEVSCKELDVLVNLASGLPGVLGARMTGAGFGGCTVNLVKAEAVDLFCEEISTGYRKETGMVPNVHICRPSQGVHSYQVGP